MIVVPAAVSRRQATYGHNNNLSEKYIYIEQGEYPRL
jgi:hypothetical protein